jgi:hypothetical protein
MNVNERPRAAEAIAKRMVVLVMVAVVRARHAAIVNGLKRKLMMLAVVTSVV